MMRRAFLSVLLLGLGVAAFGQHTEYKQELISKFPFYNVAHTRFAPVYSALARQLVEDYHVTKGICVDVGGADGSLAIELAKITNLKLYVVDISPAAVRLCNLLTDEAGLSGRVCAVEGDAQDMPLKDNFADLVISRNSMFEWPDRIAGLKEVYRILKPGGVAYVGGGFSRLLAPAVLNPLVEDATRKKAQHPESWVDMDPQLVAKLKAAGIANVRLIEGPTQFDWWLEIKR